MHTGHDETVTGYSMAAVAVCSVVKYFHSAWSMQQRHIWPLSSVIDSTNHDCDVKGMIKCSGQVQGCQLSCITCWHFRSCTEVLTAWTLLQVDL